MFTKVLRVFTYVQFLFNFDTSVFKSPNMIVSVDMKSGEFEHTVSRMS